MDNLKAFLFIGAVAFSAVFISVNGARLINIRMSEMAAVHIATSTLAMEKARLGSSTREDLTMSQLEALASDSLDLTALPLGDNKYTTTAPKKGFIYLCNVRKDQGGAFTNGPWIASTTWNATIKPTVDGEVSWANAKFSVSTTSQKRTLTGNGLPNHNTGTYPIAKTDDAYAYDRNPNSIKTWNLKDQLPVAPAYSNTPYCMGGEVGTMLSGAPLFNAFDAALRDAPAHEVQDSCSGHPQEKGEYHYHDMSACLKDKSVENVVGYALDGFPITGPFVTADKYLTTADLDVCHGITSEIVIDGKKKVSYHYVMTYDFPYSVSCFRGKPTRTGPTGNPSGKIEQLMPASSIIRSGTSTQKLPMMGQTEGALRTPPAQAISACSNKAVETPCTFTLKEGSKVSGICRITGDSSKACVPRIKAI